MGGRSTAPAVLTAEPREGGRGSRNNGKIQCRQPQARRDQAGWCEAEHRGQRGWGGDRGGEGGDRSHSRVGPTGPSRHQRVPCRPAREGTRGRGAARGLSQVAPLLLSIPVAFLKCGDAYVRLQNQSRMSI